MEQSGTSTLLQGAVQDLASSVVSSRSSKPTWTPADRRARRRT